MIDKIPQVYHAIQRKIAREKERANKDFQSKLFEIKDPNQALRGNRSQYEEVVVASVRVSYKRLRKDSVAEPVHHAINQ